MSEVTDIVLPILKGIQADIGELKRKVDGLTSGVGELNERMDAFEDYFTYTMGLTERNKADIARLGKQIRELKDKINGQDR